MQNKLDKQRLVIFKEKRGGQKRKERNKLVYEVKQKNIMFELRESRMIVLREISELSR